ADEACHAMWMYYQNNGFSRYIGAFPNADNWSQVDCDWTRYQWLCPQEHPGVGFGCGTIIPASVSLTCAGGYIATQDGHCRLDPQVEQPCNCKKDGKRNPTTPHPIVISSGAKVLEAEDYASAD